MDSKKTEIKSLQRSVTDKIVSLNGASPNWDFENVLRKLPESTCEAFNYNDAKKILLTKYNSKIWKHFYDKISESRIEYKNYNSISKIKFSEDSKVIYVGDFAGQMNSLEIRPNNSLVVSPFNPNDNHAELISCITINNDAALQSYCITGANDGNIKFWNDKLDCYNTLNLRQSFRINSIESLDFCNSEGLILIGTSVSNIFLYDFIKLRDFNFQRRTSNVRSVFFDQDDNNYYWACFDDGRICRGDIKTGTITDFLLSQGFNLIPKNCSYAYKNGKIYIALDSLRDKAIFCFDTKTQTFNPAFSLSIYYTAIMAFDITPDGRCAIIGFMGDGMAIYDLSSGDKLWDANQHFAYASAVAFSPDGTKFAYSIDSDLFVYSMPDEFIKKEGPFFSDLTKLINNINKQNNKNYCRCQII